MGTVSFHLRLASLQNSSLRSQRLHFLIQNHNAFHTQTPNPSPISHQHIPTLKPYSLAQFSASSDKNHFRCSTNNIATVADLDLGLDHEIAGNRWIRDATWVGVATIISKILGLLREIALAAAFGIGPVATAFKYAWLLPGFASSLIGGVNGPIHVTMATTLSKLSKERQRNLFQHTTAIMFLVGGVVGTVVFVYAESIIHIYAPGLWILSEGQITREIAISQLKIMIPCIVLAGPVGLGFGYMSAAGNNIFSSVSPALSSMLIIASCVCFSMGQARAFQSGYIFYGGLLISSGASLGAFLQWIIQVIVCGKTCYISLSELWVNIIRNKDVHEFFSLMLPATISSGMAQIASLTDLYFASLIPNAGAALSYAYLLAMAPVGILSSMIMLPLLPTITRLAKTLSRPSLKGNLKQAILLCMVLVLPIFSTMCALAQPIVRFLFQRSMFDSSASALVSSLFVCYSLGSPFCIARELLIVVFYALGDGQKPFLVSMIAIALNAILDWLFVTKFYLGAQGLALSTSFATSMSTVMLFFLLSRKLAVAGAVDYASIFGTCLLLLSSCIVSGFTAFLTHQMLCNVMSSAVFIGLLRIEELLAISLGGLAGMMGFFVPLLLLHFSGFKLARDLIRTLTNR